ncbi:MAG: hypothetical protein LW768_07225 [Rubrivivax sp.]|jgi:hypothetical protein|nr:hypothetical protein [Rubrivivax sp.]
MPKLSDPLMRFLKKGTFPLLDQGGLVQWRELVDALRLDFAGTMKQIEDANSGFGSDFDSELKINGVTFDTGYTPQQVFLGAMHERLSRDHGLAIRTPIQDLIQDIRSMCGHVDESDIKLGLDTKLKMGNGLVGTNLSLVPDSAWGVNFGSVPDQDEIGKQAPAWTLLKKRPYQDRLGKLGRKPHYVLAHLVNHNLNGPGDNAKNVFPFWASANTDMAKKAEGHVKEMVLRGVQVQYNISLGSPVGMTTARKKAYDKATGDAKKIIELEQYLCDGVVIDCSAWCEPGVWKPVVVGVSISNFVPETAPDV